MKKPAKPGSAPVSSKAAKPPARQSPPSEREVPAKPIATPETQKRAFEDAVRLLHAGEFSRAKAIFEEASRGQSLEICHAARIHARMCEHRMAKAAPELKSAEDHYNFAVTLMNQRSLETAEQHLRQALQMSSDAEHIHYALGLCRGLRGDVDEAAKHLKRAIELQPRNRLVARNDPDFVELSRHNTLARLLNPEGHSS